MRRLPVVPERDRDDNRESDVQHELGREHAVRVPGWLAAPSGSTEQDVGERRSLGTKLTVDGNFNASNVGWWGWSGEACLGFPRVNFGRLHA
jgi:hypothetical protein